MEQILKFETAVAIADMAAADARHAVAGSFRDPSGAMFVQDGVLYREVQPCYRAEYDQLVQSGLASDLASQGWLIRHEEVSTTALHAAGAYKVLRPERVPFVSYPYEWSFSQLRDAALLTLRIQQRALTFGMSLKDASAYNVQFVRGAPIFIDTLSFEPAVDGKPWVAYGQFCRHFLAPLALMAYRDIRLSQLLRVFVDGVPLDLASRLLPRSTRLKPSLAMHIHLHARAERHYGIRPTARAASAHVSRTALLGILDSLTRSVEKLRWTPEGTEWAKYYDETNYSTAAAAEKARVVEEMLRALSPRVVWDLGANVGRFSRLASGQGALTISMDMDPAAVERNYLSVRETREAHLLPIIVDLTNPSSSIGWAGDERESLERRGPADALLALALIHHLAIGNNVPLERISEWFSRLARAAIVEFIPKTDSQVQRMLATRLDVFGDYSEAAFESAFTRHFIIEARVPIAGTERVLYRLRGRARSRD
jgi:hypothetical protein